MKNATMSSVLSFVLVAATTSVVPLMRSSVDRPAAAIPSKAAQRDVTIVGTIVLSFEDPFVVLQRDNTFLKIRRDNISSAAPSKLEQPGATVELQVTPGAIVAAWTVDFGVAHATDIPSASCACQANQPPDDASAAASRTMRHAYAAKIASHLRRPDPVLATRFARDPNADEVLHVCAGHAADRLHHVALGADLH